MEKTIAGLNSANKSLEVVGASAVYGAKELRAIGAPYAGSASDISAGLVQPIQNQLADVSKAVDAAAVRHGQGMAEFRETVRNRTAPPIEGALRAGAVAERNLTGSQEGDKNNIPAIIHGIEDNLIKLREHLAAIGEKSETFTARAEDARDALDLLGGDKGVVPLARREVKKYKRAIRMGLEGDAK